MKNIIILLIIAALLTAYFILQDDDGAVAPPVNALSTVEPAAPAQTPAVSSESGSPVVDNAAREPATSKTAASTTGKPLEPGIRDALRELVNTSQEGLVEEETGNGVEMKLQDRFRTAPVATIDEKGEVTVRDYTSPPAQ